MDKSSKQTNYLFLGIIIIFIFVVGYNYYNFFIKNSFNVIKQIPCDPAVDSCFVSDCQSNDSTCDSKTTYKKIHIVSKYAGKSYDNLTCLATDTFCKIITCQDSTIESGEKCFK